LECDGFQYHSSNKAQQHDRNRDAYMKRVGWKVMRFTYKDLCKENIARSIQRIHDYTNPSVQKKKRAN
jgi:very-short-patch-repair endonuclease